MNKPFNLRLTDRMLRQFAGLWIMVFLAVAVRLATHGYEQIAIVTGSLAVAVGLVGLVSPRRIKPVFLASMAITYPIGWVVSHVILALIFYGLFTPIALFFRLRGRDVLGLKPQPESITYWQLKVAPKDKSQYLRQF